MKSIRIGNDIRIEWPLKLSGDIEKLEDLDLCVEVVPSKEIIDYNNYDDKPGIKVETCTVMLNGGKCKIPSRDALKAWHDRKRPEMSPIILPFTISENKIIAIWKAGDQYSVGEYDIIVYSKKNDIGQAVADQCRFVRLVAHSAQADAPADSDVEAIITLQPLTLELSGLSAYDIAVAEGFEGTRKEWLDSLRLLEKINLSDLNFDISKIGQIILGNVPSSFIVTSNNKNVGKLDCFSDDMGHMFTQVFTTHYMLPFSQNTHTDEKIFTYFRSYHISGGTSTIPTGTWGEWKLLVESLTDADIDEIIPPTDDTEGEEQGGEDEGAGGIDAGQISELKAMIDQNTADIAELQANGSKSVGNYILISVTGKSDSGDARNTRIVGKEQLTAIQDYVDKLEAKYPSQYQFNGTYIVREYNTISTYLDMIYNKMQIYHVGTYYRMTLTAQDINMSASADTGKGRMIIKGIEFAFDTQNMPDNLITYVKEAQCDVISVPEQELAQDGDMKYKNVYKVLANDGTYKKISDLLGIELITNGNGDKFLADNGQYIAIQSGGTEVQNVTLTINATPAEATVKLNNVEQKTISVEKGTQVNIEVTYEGYKSYAETITVNEDTTKEIILEPLINKEELDMNVYKIWANQQSGAVKFGTTDTETIKAFLADINAGNLALLYMTQPMPSEPTVKDYVQMMLMSYNSTQFTAIGYYQSEEIFEVGSISQYLVTVKSDGNNGYTATYSTITANLKPLNLNTAYNIPLQYRTAINYYSSRSEYNLADMDARGLEDFISNYNNVEEMIPKGKCYLTITKVDDLGGSPTEVPFDIYPDIYKKTNIGGSGVILHGISRNADTQGRRLELEISGDASSYFTITKCRYVDNSDSPIE